MKRMAVGAALLALGLASPLFADPPKSQSYEMPWYTRWFGIGAPPPPKPAPPVRRDPVREAAQLRAKAEADLMRRLQACTELQQVALDTNNPELGRKASELEHQAHDLYMKQTAGLPCSKLVPTQTESMPDSLPSSPPRTADRLPDAASSTPDGLMTPAITVPTHNSPASTLRGGNP